MQHIVKHLHVVETTVRLSITIGQVSDRGMVRAENQDACGVYPTEDWMINSSKGVLLLVADGMGGHRGGAQASRMAISIMQETYAASESSIPEALRSAMHKANRKIFETGKSVPRLQGMGTTCTALVIQSTGLYLGHVGDSRAYHIRPSGIHQLTDDHSVVGAMLRRGILTRQEARDHPERSYLLRALGTRQEVEADLLELPPPASGDCYLLCTDGLTNHLEDDEIRSLILSHPPQEASERLAQLANDRGGSDNITLQVVQLLDATPR